MHTVDTYSGDAQIDYGVCTEMSLSIILKLRMIIIVSVGVLHTVYENKERHDKF